MELILNNSDWQLVELGSNSGMVITALSTIVLEWKTDINDSFGGEVSSEGMNVNYDIFLRSKDATATDVKKISINQY